MSLQHCADIGVSFRNRTLIAVACSATLCAGAQTHPYRGEVTDSSGAVVPAASVSLLREGKTLYTTATDRTGKFVINGVRPASYILRVAAPGFYVYLYEFTSTPGEGKLEPLIVLRANSSALWYSGGPIEPIPPARMEETPATALLPSPPQKQCRHHCSSVSGMVTDTTGSPIPGAEVHLRGNTGSEFNTTTHAKGDFSFDKVERGNYTLHVAAFAFAAISQRVELYSNAVKLPSPIVLRLFNAGSPVEVQVETIQVPLKETPSDQVITRH